MAARTGPPYKLQVLSTNGERKLQGSVNKPTVYSSFSHSFLSFFSMFLILYVRSIKQLNIYVAFPVPLQLVCTSGYPGPRNFRGPAKNPHPAPPRGAGEGRSLGLPVFPLVYTVPTVFSTTGAYFISKK